MRPTDRGEGDGEQSAAFAPAMEESSMNDRIKERRALAVGAPERRRDVSPL